MFDKIFKLKKYNQSVWLPLFLDVLLQSQLQGVQENCSLRDWRTEKGTPLKYQVML